MLKIREFFNCAMFLNKIVIFKVEKNLTKIYAVYVWMRIYLYFIITAVYAITCLTYMVIF